MSDCIEYPGYQATYHPIPNGMSQFDFAKELRDMYVGRGLIVLNILAACKFKRTHEPYPIKNIIDEYGMEVIWRHEDDAPYIS